MKLLSYTHSTSVSSSYSTSSSSSAASFDANICTSKSATAGCLAGILRRILCSHSLPTHPSDHITETSSSLDCHKHRQLESKHTFEEKGTPTLVARLMGLESVPSTTPKSSITRSRSMNSLDFSASGEQREQTVKSTLSFREIPAASLEIENEEFFVLSFASASKSKERQSRRRKSEMGCGDTKQRRGEKCRNKDGKPKFTGKKNTGNHEMNEKNLSWRIPSEPDACDPLKEFSENLSFCSEDLECSTPTKQNEASNGARLRNKKIVKNVELECSSEDSSPVSVLDFDQVIISELDFVESNSRRKLSPEPQNYHSCRSRRNDNNLMSAFDDRKTKKSEGKCVGRRKKHCHSRMEYLDICDQICKITDAEIAESDWLQRMQSLKHEDVEEICADLELQILQLSLDELVHQLIGLPM